MAKPRRQEIQIVNKSTGQVLDFLFLPPKGIGGKWVRLFQEETARLLVANPQLHGQSLRVLSYLLAKVGWKNVLPPPADVATSLGIALPNVHRAYAELIVAKFVLKMEGIYYLSPTVCWKGTEEQMRDSFAAFALAGVHESKAIEDRAMRR